MAANDEISVEVDEAIEDDLRRLSIDIPACCVSVQIEGSKELQRFLEFLHRADAGYPFAGSGEFRMLRSSTLWVWDDETPGRLFLWLDKEKKHSIRAELGRQQVNCIRSALAEAARS